MLWNANMATVKAERVWYLFSCEHDVIGKKAELAHNLTNFRLIVLEPGIFYHTSKIEDRKLYLANVW